MSDSEVIARREARRRRILENSENRLQKIFGKQETVSVPTRPTFLVEEDALKLSTLHQSNGHLPTNSSKERLQSPASSSEQRHSGTVVTDDLQDPSFVSCNNLLTGLHEFLGNVQSVKKDPCTQTPVEEETVGVPLLFNPLNARRLRIICLALVVKLALIFNYGFLFGELLLLPFIIMEFTEMVIFDRKMDPAPSGSGILGVALMLSGLPPHRATLIITLINTASKIVQNLSIYFFTFVMFHASFNCL